MKADGHEYGECDFWTEKGDKLTVVGDYLGRLPALQLLDPKPGERILDAGCGAGFMARRIAGLGAKVWGCDRVENMLERGRQIEKFNPQNIFYSMVDITDIGSAYDDAMFDAIVCVGALMHDTPIECIAFFDAVYQTLKIGGRLVISITHPDLYPIERLSWIRHRSITVTPELENEYNSTFEESSLFEEDYQDIAGHWFTSTVWCHPEKWLWQRLQECNLPIRKIQSMLMTPEVLRLSNIHDGQLGYPVIWQALAVKV